MPVTRLGGYGRVGGLPPPGQMTIQPYPMPGQAPVNRYLGGFGRPGGTRPPLSLGPPEARGQNTPTLPSLSGPQPAQSNSRYLGGYGQPGNSGLPPRQGDGPPSVDNGIGILGPEEPPTPFWAEPERQLRPAQNRASMLGPPGAPRPGGLGPPVSGVGSNYDTANPGGVNWRGPVLNPGVSRGYYSGPYGRMPGTQGLMNPDGTPAMGAAQKWSVLTQPGGALRGMAEAKGWPEFTAAQALAMRQGAIESLRTAPPDPFSDPAWYAWITSGAVGEPPRRNNGPYNSPFSQQYDWEGNPLAPGAEGGGFGPEGGGGDWVGLEGDALEKWLRDNGYLGWNDAEEGQS